MAHKTALPSSIRIFQEKRGFIADNDGVIKTLRTRVTSFTQGKATIQTMVVRLLSRVYH